MTPRHVHMAALLALCLAAPAPAGAAPLDPAGRVAPHLALRPSLQFGTLPAPEGAATWEMALPVPGDPIGLDASDDRLALRTSPVDGRSWLVFSARRAGPVSGLLRVRDAAGRARAIAVAGDAVPADAFDAFLLRGEAPGTLIERWLRRTGTAIESLELPGAGLAEAVPHPSGWTRLAVGLPAGTGEAAGTLRAGGRTYGVQVSLIEAITVQGGVLLANGFEPRRIRALDERLQNGRMSARIGVLGRRSGAWRLRTFDAVPDGPTVTFVPRREHVISRRANPEHDVLLARIHHLGGEATGERFLTLLPERAAIVHPRLGVLKTYEDVSLRRIGAARASRIDENRIFAITGNGNGEWFLSRLRARRADGVMGIRHRRYTPSLQSLLGRSPLLIGDLSSIRYPRRGGGVRENLLLSVGTEQGDLRILELLRDGATIGARLRHAMQVRDPRQLPAVQKDVLPSKRAGSNGLPVQVRIAVPGQEVRVLRVSRPGAWSFLGREVIPAPFRNAGIALARARFMLAAPNGQGADILRYAWDGSILQGRALGRAGASPIDYRASARARHAWLLGRDHDTGLGAIRFLTNGLPPGTNLPPVADAGADILTSIPRVFLRARWAEPDGEFVGVRWAGNNVEFSDRYARFTTAQVPRGRSRIMVRAREGGFTRAAGAAGGVPLEDVDVVRVRHEQTTGVGPGGVGLVTKLGRPEPNPAGERTFIPFTLASPARARVDVFDLHGRRVRTLVDERLPAGGHDAVWDGLAGDGARATAGVYFVRLSAGAHVSRQRIVFVR